MHPVLFVFALAAAVIVQAANVTIDDTDTRWSYGGPWGVISAAAPCPACVAQPDASKAFDQDWHDLSQAGNATLSFTGGAVWVFAICPGGGVYRGSFSFTIDGKPDGSFLTPGETGCSDYEYNQLIYSRANLDHTKQHSLVISNYVPPGKVFSTSDLLLDYAIVNSAVVSTSAPLNPPPPSSTTGAAAPTGTVVVDDADPAWLYSGPWGSISKNAPCPQCASQPSFNLSKDATWHDCSGDCSAQLLFTGDAFAVFAICPGPLPGGSAFAGEFALTLDGQQQPNFRAPAGGCANYTYNQLVFRAVGLARGVQHNFTITNIPNNGSSTPSDLLLDYALVIDGATVQPSTPMSAGPPNTATPSASETVAPAPTPNAAWRRAPLPGLLLLLSALLICC